MKASATTNKSTDLSRTDAAEQAVSCPECDYNLTGIAGTRCPWCGWTINVDVLLQQALTETTGRRIGVIVSAFVLGSGSLLAIGLMMTRGSRLNLLDGLAVLAVVLAAGGHLLIGVMATTSRTRFPIRSRIASDISLWLAIMSVAAGVAGASGILQSAFSSTKLVRGVTVSNLFEFLLAATFFTLPAWTLLILRLVAFRSQSSQSLGNAGGIGRPAGGLMSQSPFAVEFLGPLGPAQLSQAWSPAARATSPSVERAIAETWSAEMSLADAGDRRLYNGALARLISYERGNLGAKLILGASTYREFVGTHLHNTATVLQAGREMFADAVGVSAVVATSDAWLVLGLRSDRVAQYADFVHTFGGMLELVNDTAPNVFSAVSGELHEELSIGPADVREMTLLGLVRDRLLFQPELVFGVSTRRSRGQLMAAITTAAHRHEHQRLEFLPDDPGRILAALELLERVTPVAQAAVLLHGRVAWGTTWYEQACSLLYGELPGGTGK